MTGFARAASVVAALAFSATAAFAQSSDPAWLDKLSNQLAIEHDCAVEYYLNIKEGELAGRKTYEARAQCRDGRQFDGALTEPATDFTISECNIQVC